MRLKITGGTLKMDEVTFKIDFGYLEVDVLDGELADLKKRLIKIAEGSDTFYDKPAGIQSHKDIERLGKRKGNKDELLK